ncbi:MAG TPA: glycoside hydrolase family 3 N-terminal domain-containing protein, partial [Ktedonobacterales bacterium]
MAVASAPLRHLMIVLTAICLITLSSCGMRSTHQPAPPVAHAQPTATATPPPTPPPPPTPTPTTTGADEPGVPFTVRVLVESELAGMTLDQKLGQMLLIETYYQTDTPDVYNMVHNLHAGALIIYGKNMSTRQQLHDYIAAVQGNADIPLLITMDEEGGNVDRLGSQKFYPPLPSAQWLGSTGDPQLAYQVGMQAGRELTALGINTDLAPVVDVQTVPNPIEGPRLYGSDPKTVDTYAAQFLKGLQKYGIIACLKHWPGIGSVTEDPHLTLPTLQRTNAQLQSTEFAAFKGMLPLNPGMIMVTHVIVPGIDPKLPATLSPKVVQGTLRDKYGYQGVVMTDSLYMKGISLKYNLGQAAVMSVQAGDDLL